MGDPSKLHTGAPIQTTYALQTPPACQVRKCAPQWRAHPHPSHLPGRQTRRCPPRPGEKELQTLGRLSHLSVTDRCESFLIFGGRGALPRWWWWWWWCSCTRPRLLGLSTSVPRTLWKETRAQYSARLRHIVAAINGHHDVEGLCRGLPGRLGALKRHQGDKLKS